MMEYKGFAAGPIDFDPDDKTFSGTVAGLRDVIHFEGRTARWSAPSARASTAIWSFAPKPASSPTVPFNGKILVRTKPELHRKAVLRAAVEGVSLSRWISRQIESAR